MMLCATEEALHHELALKPAAERLGVALEPLTPEQARALNPGVDIQCAGGVLFPLDCFLSPPRLLAALRAARSMPVSPPLRACLNGKSRGLETSILTPQRHAARWQSA